MTLTIKKPFLVTISIFNSRTIFAMQFAIQVPTFVTIRIFNSRTIFAMQFAIQVPMLATICHVNGHCWSRHINNPVNYVLIEYDILV